MRFILFSPSLLHVHSNVNKYLSDYFRNLSACLILSALGFVSRTRQVLRILDTEPRCRVIYCSSRKGPFCAFAPLFTVTSAGSWCLRFFWRSSLVWLPGSVRYRIGFACNGRSWSLSWRVSLLRYLLFRSASAFSVPDCIVPDLWSFHVHGSVRSIWACSCGLLLSGSSPSAWNSADLTAHGLHVLCTAAA